MRLSLPRPLPDRGRAAAKEGAALREVAPGIGRRVISSARSFETVDHDLLPCFWADLCWKIPV
jgi:hypothetical protein